MFKNKKQKEVEAEAIQSTMMKKEPQQLRKDFLNNNLNNLSSYSSHINSSLPEESSESDLSSENQQPSQLRSNISQPSQMAPQHQNQKQTRIIRNSKNWREVDLGFHQDQENSHEIGNKQAQNKCDAKVKLGQRKQSKSRQVIQQKSAQPSLQVINYKTMLKNEIKKSKKMQQQLSMQEQKNNYMSRLIEKLKEENNLLQKLLKKQKERNLQEQQTRSKINGKNRSKFCECDGQRTPSSLFTNKYSKLCQSSKLLK